MLRRLYLIFSLLFTVQVATAIEAGVSHAIFYLPDPLYQGNMNPYMEAYWQVNPKTVHYKTEPGKGIIARLQTEVKVTNDTGGIIKEDRYIFQSVPCANAGELSKLTMIDLNRYFITTGFIKMQLTLTDLNDTSNHFVFTDTFTVPKVPYTPFYGGPEFIDTFYTSDVKTPFRKHGQQYIPLCEGFYDDFKSKLNYYAEVYRMDKLSPADFPLIQSVYISRKQDEDPFNKYFKLDTIKDQQQNCFTGTFDISSLPSGNYFLNFSLGTQSHRTLATKTLFFQRMNTSHAKADLTIRKAELDTTLENVNVLDLSKTFIAKYDINQVRAILKMLLPLSDPGGVRTIEGFLKKTDEMYMRYYIYNHFADIDKQNPEKAWKEYSEKVKKVNKLFSGHGRPGFETDRGFMYLRYGAPTDIITKNNESGSLPYELWQYNSLKQMNGKEETNAMILFYKSSATDFDYKVLHTTISSELHNMAWRSFLYTNENGEDHSNSLAEEYIGKK